MIRVKKIFKTFYLPIAAITILVLGVFIFMSLFGDYILIDESEVTKIYFADNMSRSHKQVIENFNRLNKNKIEVVPVDLPFEKFSTNERKELLIRYLRSNSDRIDLFSVDQIWVPRFTKWTEPMSNFFSMKEREKFIEPALQTCFYKNQLYGIPLYFDISMMYYREDLLKKDPEYKSIRSQIENNITWEKFIEIGKRFDKKNPFFIFPGDAYEGLMCGFVGLIKSQNADIVKGDSVKLATPEVKKGLQLLVDFVNNYKLSPPEVTRFKETDANKYFLKHDGVFLRDWPGFMALCNDNLDGGSKCNNIRMAPLPYFAGGRPAHVTGGWNLMISKTSTKKKEVMEFINYLISEEAQKIFYSVNNFLPVIKSLYNNQRYLEENPELKFFKELMKNAVHRPFHEMYTRYSDVIAYYANLAIKNEITVDEALKNAEEIINSGKIFIK
jgi:multiple sugar transport system substrate-binding protein